MYQATSRRHAVLWWLASFLLLGTIFASGVLKSNALPALAGNYPTTAVNTHPSFEAFNELMVTNVIDRALSGIAHPKGFLFQIPNGGYADVRVPDLVRPGPHRPDWMPSRAELSQPGEYYRTQIGLQGRAYAFAAAKMNWPRDQTFLTFRIVSSFALAAVLGVLIAFILACWGRPAAAAALAFCAVSTGLNLFSWSLFWSAFLHAAPTAITAVLALALPSRSFVRPALLLGAMFIVLVIKLASGFEFFTTVLAATVVPFVMVYATGRITIKTMFGYSLVALVIGVAAFAATLAIYEAVFFEAFGGSGLEWLRNRTTHWGTPPRTGILGQFVNVAKILAMNAVDVGGYGLPTGLFVLVAMPFLMTSVAALVRGRMEDERVRIALVIAVALGASASWVLIQFAHVSVHNRFATFLVAYPFGIFLCAALARLWQLHRARRVSDFTSRAEA